MGTPADAYGNNLLMGKKASNLPRQPEVQDSAQGPVTPVRQGRKGRKPQKKKNDQNWVACDSCHKWRTIEFEWVDAKTFKCSFVGKTCEEPHDCSDSECMCGPEEDDGSDL